LERRVCNTQPRPVTSPHLTSPHLASPRLSSSDPPREFASGLQSSCSAVGMIMRGRLMKLSHRRMHCTEISTAWDPRRAAHGRGVSARAQPWWCGFTWAGVSRAGLEVRPSRGSPRSRLIIIWGALCGLQWAASSCQPSRRMLSRSELANRRLA
jgi:hypothetical protein